MRKKNAAAAVHDYYPVVFISDTHLGMETGASDLLCEFLHHIKCGKLILNGDIIDGYRLETHAAADFSEAQKRVLDALNRKIVEGTEVVYLPGNHDIKLRQMGLSGKTIMGMRFEDKLDFTDPQGRRFFVCHGDEFDALEINVQNGKVPAFARALASDFGEACVKASAVADKLSHKLLGRHLRVLSGYEKFLKRVNGKERKNRTTLTDHARKNGYDGFICGHFHAADIRQMKDGMIYMNTGDWVEGFEGLAVDQNGNWKVLEWTKMRGNMGLKQRFQPAANDNPDQEFRPATERMLAAIKDIWPGAPKKKKPKKKFF